MGWERGGDGWMSVLDEDDCNKSPHSRMKSLGWISWPWQSLTQNTLTGAGLCFKNWNKKACEFYFLFFFLVYFSWVGELGRGGAASLANGTICNR